MPRRKKARKIWTTPVLTVIVRGKPEERLLGGCKRNDLGGGSMAAAGGCTTTPVFPCTDCAALAIS